MLPACGIAEKAQGVVCCITVIGSGAVDEEVWMGGNDVRVLLDTHFYRLDGTDIDAAYTAASLNRSLVRAWST